MRLCESMNRPAACCPLVPAQAEPKLLPIPYLHRREGWSPLPPLVGAVEGGRGHLVSLF
jgi:hypothetical protein